MTGREGTDPKLAAALDAYRAAAHAEADAHFDERALEVQRQRILQRIEQAGQRARVLHFPTTTTATRPSAVDWELSSSRKPVSLKRLCRLLRPTRARR